MQNDGQFADDISKNILLKEKCRIVISLILVPMGPINNKSALVLFMAPHHRGEKPLILTNNGSFTEAYMRHSASMSKLLSYGESDMGNSSIWFICCSKTNIF